MKERNTTLDSFRELPTDCILIYERVVVVVLLHEFVSSDQAFEYFITMADMWEFGECVTRTCSLETKMAMFGHRFCYNNCVLAKSPCKPWTYPSHFLGFSPLSNVRKDIKIFEDPYQMFIVMLELVVKYDDFEPIFPKTIIWRICNTFFWVTKWWELAKKTIDATNSLGSKNYNLLKC